MSKIKSFKLSQVFFWLFLISLPFNTRIIYQPDRAYIQGYFSYYLAIFLYLSDILLFLCFTCNIIENWAAISQKIQGKWSFYTWIGIGLIISSFLGWFHVKHIDFWVFYSVFKVIEFILVVWLTFKLNLGENFSLIAFAVLYISSVFQALVGIVQFHVQHGVGLRILGEYIAPLTTGGLATLDTQAGKVLRAYGTFPHPNILAAFLVFGLILGYWFIVSRGTQRKSVLWFEIGDYLLIMGIFFTFSRVSWVIAAFATLAFLWYVRASKKPIFLAIFIPALVSCATILIFWHGLLFARVSNITTSNSYTERLSYNIMGLKIFEKHPLFGTGAGNYIPTMEQMFHVQPWNYQPSHNIFIYIAASVGIIGLFIFLLLIWEIFRELWKAQSSLWKFSLLVWGISLIFMSLFDHFLVTIQQGQLLLALSLGLMLAYARKN